MIKNEIEGRGEVLQSQLLCAQSGVNHFCSMRGSINPMRGVWMPSQVHGADVVLLDETWLKELDVYVSPNIVAHAVPKVDAVITRLKGQWIGVLTADCVPVLLYDPRAEVVAAVHAGWRGTVKHIVRLTLERMIGEMGCQPGDILAMVGPSISPEAYEVGEEVAAEFQQAGRGDCVLRSLWGPSGQQTLAKPHVDLWQSNVMDMLEAGLELQNIDCTPWCTFEHKNELYSARCEGIGTGRIVSAIQLR